MPRIYYRCLNLRMQGLLEMRGVKKCLAIGKTAIPDYHESLSAECGISTLLLSVRLLTIGSVEVTYEVPWP